MFRHLRRLFSLLIKAAISALLLYLSLRWVNLGEVGERLARVHADWLAIAGGTVLVQVGFLAMRWRSIVMASGVTLSGAAALRYSLIATFFNQTLPSTIGGDAARVWMLARNEAGWKNATYSVLIDRAVGLFALAVIVLAFLPWTLELVRDPVARAATVAIGLAGVGGPLAFVAVGFGGRLLDRWWATRHVVAASRLAWAICSSARVGFPVAALSLLIHTLTVATAWAAAKAIAAPLDFTVALSLIPPVVLVATIPVSIAGWGVRESAMIAAFTYAGLVQSDGLIVSLIFGAASFAVGALGGIVWIVSGERVQSVDVPDVDAHERR